MAVTLARVFPLCRSHAGAETGTRDRDVPGPAGHAGCRRRPHPVPGGGGRAAGGGRLADPRRGGHRRRRDRPGRPARPRRRPAGCGAARHGRVRRRGPAGRGGHDQRGGADQRARKRRFRGPGPGRPGARLPAQGNDQRPGPGHAAGRRSAVSRSRPALPRWAVIAAISGAGVFAAADAVLEHGAGVPWYVSIPDALVGWAYITGGVVAYRARQLDRTATLMTAIGVIWNLDNVAQYVHALLPYVVWLGGLVDPLLAQLLLSYPSRALRSRLERAVLAAAYLQVLVVNGARAVFVNLRDYYPCPCVHSFPTVRNPAVFNALETEVKIAYVIIGTAVLALVFRRWRRASGPARRALNPLWFAGLATMTALILDAALGFARLTPVQNNAEAAVVTVVRLSVPVALLIGLVRIRQSRS